MRHGISGRKFNRPSAHRKSMFANLAKSLIQFEQIKTTVPKAKDLRPIVEKLVTLGKKNTLHARRQLIAKLGSNETATKLLDVLAKRYADRPGGYLRIIKAGYRYGDNAPMAYIEFIDRDPAAKPKGEKQVSMDEDMVPATATA
jgi:large subunit ribosomal protein L17